MGVLELAGHDPLPSSVAPDRLTEPAPADELESRIGHRFARRSLLREALTHASATSRGRRTRRSNERLEFLGDRVLGLVIAARLIVRFPHDPEGALSRRHAALVRQEMLCAIAAKLGLGAWLEVARSEEDGGRNRPAILADSLEALIGALYLDGGLEAAERFIRRHWAREIDTMGAPPRDAKTALQEWAQGRGLARPVYAVLGIEGPAHAPSFEVEVALADVPPARAVAASKRAAEQAAAQALLDRLESADGRR